MDWFVYNVYCMKILWECESRSTKNQVTRSPDNQVTPTGRGVRYIDEKLLKAVSISEIIGIKKWKF